MTGPIEPLALWDWAYDGPGTRAWVTDDGVVFQEVTLTQEERDAVSDEDWRRMVDASFEEPRS